VQQGVDVGPGAGAPASCALAPEMENSRIAKPDPGTSRVMRAL
jgi:hypothetical protein